MKISDTNANQYHFYCEGCGEVHAVGYSWDFNGDFDKPTFHPSILVRWGESQPNKRCHSFIRDGKIQYLNDCHHELAGQTVELREQEDWFNWGEK